MRRLQERNLPLAFHSGFMWGGDRTMELCNRFIAVHALGFTWYNVVHLTNWIVNGHAGAVPKAQGAVDRERPRLAAVPDAAARQRIHDAQLRGAAAQGEAERLHAPDVLHHPADGDGGQPQGARAHLRAAEGRHAAALLVRLSPLGHGSAEHHLRSAVPQRAVQAQHPRRQRQARVQSPADLRSETKLQRKAMRTAAQ